MEIPRRDVTTDLGLLLIVLIWGVNFSVLKVVLRELDPLALNALRFPMAAVALWILVRRLDGSLKPDPEDLRRIITLGLLGNVAYQLCFIFGVDSTFAGNASLLLATTPVWTLFLSSVAGHERPGAWAIIGVAGTLIGIFMVITGNRDAGTLASATTRGFTHRDRLGAVGDVHGWRPKAGHPLWGASRNCVDFVGCHPNHFLDGPARINED